MTAASRICSSSRSTALREDPDDPLVKERLKKARPEKKDKEERGGAPAVKVDVAGIDRRAVQLTRGTEADGAYFLSADGKLVYFVSADERGRGLFSVGIDGKDRKRVADGAFAGLTPPPTPRRSSTRRTASCTRWSWPARRRRRRSTRPSP